MESESRADILLYEKQDHVVTMTMNRPERLNALSFELWDKLRNAFQEFKNDDDAWVAILTGVGDKAFCAGADMKAIQEYELKGIPLPSDVPDLDPFITELFKPTIAAVNGLAIAGGMWLAMCCNIRIASDHAEFGIAETRWNMPIQWVATLGQHLLLNHAIELALWGDGRINAERAYEIGFVNKVVPKGKALEEAMAWADRMRYLAPRCVRNSLEMILRGAYANSAHDALRFARVLEKNLGGMEDSREGRTAFAEKRKPVFRNK